MSSLYSKQRPRILIIGVLLLVIALVALVAWPLVRQALQRAAMAEALSNLRPIKFALDSFATDFDGQYPSDETSERVSDLALGSTWSNDYFRQLFLAGEILDLDGPIGGYNFQAAFSTGWLAGSSV